MLIGWICHFIFTLGSDYLIVDIIVILWRANEGEWAGTAYLGCIQMVVAASRVWLISASVVKRDAGAYESRARAALGGCSHR